MTWPRWEDVAPAAKARIGNGVGPNWFPPPLRRAVTRLSARFFREASWAHHDYGYLRGGSERDRWRCDWLFFRAMVRDALSRPPGLRPTGLALAACFYLTCMAFGWTGFRYGRHAPPAWLEEP